MRLSRCVSFVFLIRFVLCPPHYHLRLPSSSFFHVPPVLPFVHPCPTSVTPFSSSLLRCVALTLHFFAFSFSPSRT
ncbi:hypothetical protein C8R44DRAFT_823112, partial [Mycena epipterygia]